MIFQGRWYSKRVLSKLNKVRKLAMVSLIMTEAMKEAIICDLLSILYISICGINEINLLI